jgi:hypothetical protein
MKNAVLFAFIVVIITSCGFQQRKYTHGYWGDYSNTITRQESIQNPSILEEKIVQSTDHLAYATISLENDPNELDMDAIGGENQSDFVTARKDTIHPDPKKNSTDEDFMTSRLNKNEYATTHDPCYDPYREALMNEATNNVLWGVLSLFGSALYLIGLISGCIYFFKSLKTHKKIKELNADGRYKDLQKLNFVAILANGSIFALCCLTLFFILLYAVLSGNF